MRAHATTKGQLDFFDEAQAEHHVDYIIQSPLNRRRFRRRQMLGRLVQGQGVVDWPEGKEDLNKFGRQCRQVHLLLCRRLKSGMHLFEHLRKIEF